MITDKTLDEALVEAHRFIKAAMALRAARKALRAAGEAAYADGGKLYYFGAHAEHAACKRASLDLTRKLADLRQGR